MQDQKLDGSGLNLENLQVIIDANDVSREVAGVFVHDFEVTSDGNIDNLDINIKVNKVEEALIGLGLDSKSGHIFNISGANIKVASTDATVLPIAIFNKYEYLNINQKGEQKKVIIEGAIINAVKMDLNLDTPPIPILRALLRIYHFLSIN